MTDILATPDLTSVHEAARRHLWMHFSGLSAKAETATPMIVRGKGAYVWDDKGRRYIDGLASLYCVNVGHGRSEIVEAVSAQLAQLEYFPAWGYITPPAAELAQRIAELAPGNLNRVFFTSGGSESVESAWKFARQYHYLRGDRDKVKIISRSGAYHGTTLGALSITAIPAMQAPFGPLVPGVLHAPQVNNYRASVSPEQHAREAADAVADLIESEGPDTVAAMIVEPVQNAGGCLPAHPTYFARLREICDQYGVLLISDETICSWGRIGTYFGSAALGYQPDIITTAKGLTSAYVPMGAVIIGEHLAEPFLQEDTMFEHGLTFGGHPAAAAAALANIRILDEENLCSRAAQLGERLHNGLDSLRDCDLVGDVRGAGFFWALELVADRDTKTGLAAETLQRWAKEIPAMLYERGLICRAVHRGSPVIQFAPTLVMTDQDVDDLVGIVGDVLRIKSRERSASAG